MSDDVFSKWRPKVVADEDAFSQWRVPEKPKPTRSLGASSLRQVKRVGRAAATGIAGLADIPNLAAMGLYAAGLKKTPTFYDPVASRVQEGIDTFTGDELKPENKSEEYFDIIGEGLAPIALAPLTGGASLTGTVAKGLAKTGAKIPSKIATLGASAYKPTAANIGQSVGSSAALKAYIDQGGDPGIVGSLLASTAGGMGGRGVVRNIPKIKKPLNVAAEIAGKTTGFSPEKYTQNVEIGLPVSFGTVSKSDVPNYLEMIAAKMPGSMGTLEKFYKFREADIARNLGLKNTHNLEKAVQNVPKHLAKEGAENYHTRASNIYKRREKEFRPREEQAIRNQEKIDVSDLINELQKKKELSLTPAAQNRFDKSREGILLKELKDSISESPAESMSKQLRSEGYPEDLINKILKSEEIGLQKKGIGFHDLNKLREKALHESIALKSNSGAGTPESKNAAERHKMLSGKRHQFMEEVGTPKEIHNARQARKFWSQYKNKEDGMSKYVAKLTGEHSDSTAFNRLLSGDPKYLNVARQGLSKDQRKDLASGIVAHLGERQGRFNINTFHTGYSNLETPVKKEFLKTLSNHSSQKTFDKTMKLIGENKRMMDRLANTSNTAHTKNLMDSIKRYGVALTAAATGVNYIGLLGLTLGGASLYGGAKIWTNQKFLKRVNDAIIADSKIGKENKLDALIKAIEQTGTHHKHLDKKESNNLR